MQLRNGARLSRYREQSIVMDGPPFKLGEPRYDQVPQIICELLLPCIVRLRHLNSTHETRIIPNILVNSNSMFHNVVEYFVCKQYIDSIRIQDRLIVKSYSGQAGNINISTYCVTLLVDYTCVHCS